MVAPIELQLIVAGVDSEKYLGAVGIMFKQQDCLIAQPRDTVNFIGKLNGMNEQGVATKTLTVRPQNIPANITSFAVKARTTSSTGGTIEEEIDIRVVRPAPQ